MCRGVCPPLPVGKYFGPPLRFLLPAGSKKKLVVRERQHYTYQNSKKSFSILIQGGKTHMLCIVLKVIDLVCTAGVEMRISN